jgi:hypothetical protein
MGYWSAFVKAGDTMNAVGSREPVCENKQGSGLISFVT